MIYFKKQPFKVFGITCTSVEYSEKSDAAGVFRRHISVHQPTTTQTSIISQFWKILIS